MKKHKNTNAQYANKHKKQKGYGLSLTFAKEVKEQKKVTGFNTPIKALT